MLARGGEAIVVGGAEQIALPQRAENAPEVIARMTVVLLRLQ